MTSQPAPAPEAAWLAHAPPEAAWLVRLLGAADALRLVEAHGGVRIKIPSRKVEGSTLAASIGERALGLLVAEMGGNTLPVPLARPWRAIALRRRDGLSYSAIARALLTSESQVYRWLDSAQGTRPAARPARAGDASQPKLPGL